VEYEKPEVRLLSSAIEAVQDSIIKAGPPLEYLLQETVPAYQSDER